MLLSDFNFKGSESIAGETKQNVFAVINDVPKKQPCGTNGEGRLCAQLHTESITPELWKNLPRSPSMARFQTELRSLMSEITPRSRAYRRLRRSTGPWVLRNVRARIPGLAECNCNGLLPVCHFLPTTGNKFTVFEFIHNSTDFFLSYCFGFLRSHGSFLPFADAPYRARSRPGYVSPHVWPPTCPSWREGVIIERA
jgi:hypothetical protein